MNQPSGKSNNSKLRELPKYLLFLVRMIAVLVFIVIFYVLSLRFGFVQNWTKDQVLNYINSNYHQDIHIDKFYFDPFDGFTAGILIKDHHQDTLFYTSKLEMGLYKSLLTLYNRALSMDDLTMQSSVFKLIQYEGESKTNLDYFLDSFRDSLKSSSKPFEFNIKKIQLSDSKIYLRQDFIEAKIQFSELNATIDSVNNELKHYRFRKILLDNPVLEFTKSINPDTLDNDASIKNIEADSCKEGFGIAIDFVNINDGSFSIAIEKPDSFQRFQFNNIFFSSFNAYISEDLKQFDFIHLNAKTKDEFMLKNVAINHFMLNKRSFNIDKLKLETGRSNLEVKVQMKYPSGTSDDHKIENVIVQAEIAGSLIDPKDISYFVPHWNLYNFIRAKTSLPFYLKGNVFGTLNNLKGKGIEFKYEDQFSFQGDVHARNLLVKDKELINLKIQKLATTAAFIRTLFPEYNIPEGYNQFGKIILNGNFDGYFHDFVAFGDFQTDLGYLHSDIKLKLSKADQTALYSGSFDARQLDLGKLLGDSNFGKINLTSKILDGKGLNKDNIFANLEALVSDFEYKKYHYKDIRFKGNINKDHFLGEFRIVDENADLHLKGNISRKHDDFKIQLTSAISKLNLKALHFSEDSLDFSGNINCDITGSQESNFNGYFEAVDNKIFIHNNNVDLKKFRLEQVSSNNKRNLKLNSDFINFEVEGIFSLKTIKNEFFAYLIDKYPGLSNAISSEDLNTVSKTVAKGFVYIKNGTKLNQLTNFPVLIDKADCDFIFDNSKNIFEVTSNRFDLQYKDIFLSKLSLDIVSTEKLKLLFTSDYISKDLNRVAGNFKFSTSYDGETGQSLIQLFDSSNAKILINASSGFSYYQDTFKLMINNKDLFVENVRWRVNEKNVITKAKNSLQISNLELTDSTHFISIRDYNKQGLILKTDGFDISLVNPLIKNKNISFSGLFASEINIPDLNKISGSTAKINIFQLHFNKDNFGPFNIDASIDDVMKPWNVKIENIFQEHIIRGIGTINIPIKRDSYEYKPFDFSVDLDLKSFPMAFLENFISSIHNTSGSADGKMKFYSNDHKLFLTGDMHILKGGTTINYLGVPVQFSNQYIKFLEYAILFDKVAIEDKLGNPISLNGKLTHSHLKDFAADIQLRSDKALILDTKKGENLFYYGYGIGSVDVKFLGLFDKMDMDVHVTSAKGTKINIPIQNNEVASESKFVKFINKQSETPADTVIIHNPIEGLNLNMQLSITEDAEIYIIFDELAGDIMKGYGRGDLTIKSLRNNLFTVNGHYEVEEGQYLFTLYNFVNKPFAIKRGGTINWTGDPLDADINIEAVYEGLYTYIYPLIEEYYPDEIKKQEVRQQRTAVKVRMLLTGSLLKPNIKFDIDLPELTGDAKNFAETKLRILRANEDQLNQQIFGLLVLRSFINTSNDKGELVGKLNIGATTINTLSEMLSNQFSLFVSNLLSNAFDDVDFISGVDFNIGYDLSNENVGTTNLNEGEVVFSLKHRLWNDKWIVTLGGNYKSSSSNSLYGNSYFNPESVIEWNTPVKGLKLRIYYKADESLEGVKHKIGAGVNYRKEFDSFLDFEGELKAQSRKLKEARNEERKL